MTLFYNTLTYVRRIRSQSWKDIVILFGICLFGGLLSGLLAKIAPNIPETARNRVVMVLCIIAAIICIVMTGD